MEKKYEIKDFFLFFYFYNLLENVICIVYLKKKNQVGEKKFILD